jgi:hypothetical protein
MADSKQGEGTARRRRGGEHGVARRLFLLQGFDQVQVVPCMSVTQILRGWNKPRASGSDPSRF